MNKPEKLNPFTNFCKTIGNLPSSYLESMTYEEQILWLCNYLQNTVIPTVNNNSELTEQLQISFVEVENLCNQLNDYVTNYFNNLDVQEEINNKLDAMVEDGTLEEIIDPILNAYKEELLETENNFEQEITSQQNNFEQEITSQQNNFEQEITSQQNSFEQEITSQQNSFEQEITSEQAGFETTVGNAIIELSSEVGTQNSKIQEFNTKINNIASGTPAGVFNDLAELNYANPDHSYIYLTVDNGNWNYWNGTAFISGGVYQSTGIANKSITPEKTSFLLNESNLFDKNNAILSNLMKGANSNEFVAVGVIGTNAVHSVIWKCEPNTSYNVSHCKGNKTEIYLSSLYPAIGVNINSTTYVQATDETIDGYTRYAKNLTTSINDNYMVILYNNTTGNDDPLDYLQITKGEELKPYMNYFQNYTDKGLILEKNNIPNGEIIESKLSEDLQNKINHTTSGFLDAKEDLGVINNGSLVICVDDGTSYDNSVAFQVIQNKNIPMVFALMNESDIITTANYLQTLRGLIANYGCEVAQHGSATMTGWTKEQIDTYLSTQLQYFSSINLDVKNFIAPQNESDGNLRIVGSNYFNLMCSKPNEINYRRTNRYELGRYAITPRLWFSNVSIKNTRGNK